jgi:hypothetical protein
MNRLKTVQAWQFTLQNIDGNEKATETGWIPQERKCKPEKAKAKKKRPIPRNEWVIMRGFCSLPGHRGADHS